MIDAGTIHTAYEKFIEAEERRSAHGQRDYVFASSWSECTRSMALDLICPDKKPQFPVDTLANFRRGRDRERDLVSDLIRIGRFSEPQFEVVGGQERFELRDRKGRIAIVGKVDARLKCAGRKGSAPLEIKSFHPSLTQSVKTFDDMLHSRWLKRGAHQLLAYLLATNEPLGFLLLDRPGIPRPIDVPLFDYLEQAEDFLQRAEIAIDSLADWKANHDIEKALPRYIDRPDECRSCLWFGSVCNPPMKYDGAQIFTDEETIQKTERLAELEADLTSAGLEEYEALDKWSKVKFRGVKQAIVGKCLVSGRWQRDTKYNLTDEAKKKIEAIKKQFAEKVEEGKFFLTISKVG